MGPEPPHFPGTGGQGLALSPLGAGPRAFVLRPSPGGLPSSLRTLLSFVMVSSCGPPNPSSERKPALPSIVLLKNSSSGFGTAFKSVIARV